MSVVDPLLESCLGNLAEIPFVNKAKLLPDAGDEGVPELKIETSSGV